MSLNAAVIEVLVAKGMSAADILEVARASEVKADRTNAERQARHRAKKRNAVTVTGAPPNDIYSNPPEPSGAKAPATPFSEIVVQAWNDGPGKAGATVAKSLDAGRRKALTVRLREHGEEAVLEAIRNLSGSPWHCGKNDRGWQANIGWLLKSPENFQRALEMGPKQKQADAAPDFLDHISSKYQVAA